MNNVIRISLTFLCILIWGWVDFFVSTTGALAGLFNASE